MKNLMIWKYIKKYKYQYIIGIIILFLVDFINLYIPQFTGNIIDGLDTGTMGINGLKEILIKILIAGGLLTIGRFGWRFYIFGSARKIEYSIRNDLFAHLEKLSLGYYNKNKTGDLMSHFTNDINAVRMSVGPAVITSFDAVIMTIMVLTKMATYVNLSLTLMAVIPLLFIAFGGYYYGKAVEKRFTKKQEAFSELTDQVQESISGVRVIKAFVQERNEFIAFARANEKNKEMNLRVVKLNAVVIPLLDVIIGISSLITLLYGGYLTIQGEITLGNFVGFNQYVGMLVWPMIAAGESISLFSQGFASMKRLDSIMKEEAEIVDESTVKDVDKLYGNIQIKELNFGFHKELPGVIQNLSVDIEAGKTIAVLGRTGSGKSVLSNLLLRLYNVERGMISFDGIDIRDIPLNVLRENIAYVPQDNFLFSDTLGNNIAFGAKDKSEETMIKATKDACIHDNIMDFSNKYETIVGERGVTLSGGQKQRSSIARALMKDSPILILDDALSAVDTNTEEAILENLKHNRVGKTTIIIAHRISTIQNADSILVLEDGVAKEYGSHEELLNIHGIYEKMYIKQQLEKQLESV